MKKLIIPIVLGLIIVSCESKKTATKAEKEAMEVKADGDTVDARTTPEGEGSLGERFMEPDSL